MIANPVTDHRLRYHAKSLTPKSLSLLPGVITIIPILYLKGSDNLVGVVHTYTFSLSNLEPCHGAIKGSW